MRKSLVSTMVAIAAFGLVACGDDDKAEGTPATPTNSVEQPFVPAKADDHSPEHLTELTRLFETDLTPSKERRDEYTESCWAKASPFYDLDITVTESRWATPGTATVTGDTATVTFADKTGKTFTEKWRYVNGTWLIDC